MIEIPKELKEEIQEEIIKKSKSGENGWRFAKNDEDTLLGDYLGKLRTDRQIFNKENIDYEWEILYHKMTGRGKNAYESKIGADAIITFEIIDKIKNNRTIKSLIFQAKKKGNSSGLRLQKDKMDRVAEKGNFIFTCSENGYYAQTEINGERTNIGEFLAYQFIQCKIGIEDFEYDEEKRILKLNDKLMDNVYIDEVLIKVELEHNNSNN